MKSRAELRLKAEGVAITRGGRSILSDLSFHVCAGDALVVTGPNGSGKSSLLRAVAGLIAPAAGRIYLEGGALSGAVHLVGHNNALKAQLSVLENALFWARWQGGAEVASASDVDAETRAEDALAAVGLLRLADTPGAYLSQGQRRRLALARLVASPRPVWLLDEPVAGLDAASRDLFAASMARHLDGGGLIMAATHEPLGLDRPREMSL